MQSCRISIFNDGEGCCPNDYFSRVKGVNLEAQEKLFIKLQRALKQLQDHESYADGFEGDVEIRNWRNFIQIHTMNPLVGRILTKVWLNNRDLVKTAYYNTAFAKKRIITWDIVPQVIEPGQSPLKVHPAIQSDHDHLIQKWNDQLNALRD